MLITMAVSATLNMVSSSGMRRSPPRGRPEARFAEETIREVAQHSPRRRPNTIAQPNERIRRANHTMNSVTSDARIEKIQV